MNDIFTNRSATMVLAITPLDCFAKAQTALDNHYPDISNAVKSNEYKHATNIAIRYGDIHLCEYNLKQALTLTNCSHGVILSSSYLNSYFVCVKSLLDAFAICLAEIYGLQLTKKEQDFNNPRFWKFFATADQKIHDKYVEHKEWYRLVRQWRDSAVHRISPLIIVHSSGPPEEAPKEQISIRMFDAPDTGVQELVATKNHMSKWIEPTHYPTQWRSRIDSITELVISDIQRQLITDD